MSANCNQMFPQASGGFAKFLGLTKYGNSTYNNFLLIIISWTYTIPQYFTMLYTHHLLSKVISFTYQTNRGPTCTIRMSNTNVRPDVSDKLTGVTESKARIMSLRQPYIPQHVSCKWSMQ